MILVGVIGFYLGIDIPPMRVQVERQRMEAVELLSAIGTFLAAVAALVSVYAIVLDEVPQRPWQYAIGCWWLLGVMMQTAAGLVARLRLARAVR
jgi:Mg2+ and Co2+ transporter CorA